MYRKVNKTGVGHADRLYAYAIRTCILNLIAQIALGTPVAAQIRENSHPLLMPGQTQTAPDLSARPVKGQRLEEERRICPTRSALNVLAMEVDKNKSNRKEK